jgi:signal transduction histidine kinase
MPDARILIVEDESIIALDIKTSLQHAGYSVAGVASSGEEAIALALAQKPDLLLMDIRLRGQMDGIEAAQQIRAQFPCPVVFLTAHADRQTLDRAQLTEPFGYLTKPFEDHSLITTIEIALARYRSEAAVREALKQQREFNELRSRFVSVVSHEFRNPLNTILFSTELLHRYEDRLEPERRELYFQRIHGAVKRMHNMLDDVLIMGETDAGKLACQPEPLAIAKFCQDIISELQPEEQPICPILFTYEVAPSLPPDVQPILDRKLLFHILGNLLSNAVKYSAIGSPVVFDLSLTPETIQFRIQDQGIGIPEKDLAELFHDFHRASNARSIPGTGLGLSIVKQCVEIHGGEILVDSQENQGSTFTVTLPISMPIATAPELLQDLPLSRSIAHPTPNFSY